MKTKLKRIKTLKSEDLFILISFANVDLENRYVKMSDMKYKNLLMDSSHEENKNVSFPVDDIIDDLMFDNYKIYLKMKDRIEEKSNFVDDFDDLGDDFNNQYSEYDSFNSGIINKFIELYEKLMLESKFEYANIRSVQKQLLNDKLEKYIKLENYEYCIELKTKISLI